MILACFMCKIAFDHRLKRDNYYDNCMYSNAELEQVLKFNGYNITARLGIIYEYTIEYSNLLFSSKRDRLLTANLIKNPKTTNKQILSCKTVLNDFILQTWPDNSFVDLKSPIFRRQRLAKAAI